MKIPFQALIEQISDYAIVALDAQGLVQSWNAGARALTGYTEREAIGRPLSGFLAEDLVAEAIKGGKATGQCWLMRKSGKPLWTENVIQTVTAARGATSLCWVCQDPFSP